MLPTTLILEALEAYITALGLFDRVSRHHAADLPQALEALRDPARKICFIVGGTDTWEHKLLEDYNAPLRSEMSCEVQLLVSSQDATFSTSGDPAILPLKDHLQMALLWENLSHPGLLCLPQTCEPLRIEWDDAPARTAWQITLAIHQHINP